jgi:glutamate N-acetyltransferase/amino-acid N-acetyltransferase
MNADDKKAVELFSALEEVFVDLAQMLARDGEGATKFVTVAVEGAADKATARAVAETIAHSPLVKTALFASDPNWGRILAAVGRAPVMTDLDVAQVAIWLGDVQIVAEGAVAPGYTEAAGAAVMQQKEITIRVDLGQGEASQMLWTCDFSYDYVKINAEYRT